MLFSRPFAGRVTSDVMGDAYEFLIKKFADATNKKAGEFYTPRSVVRLMHCDGVLGGETRGSSYPGNASDTILPRGERAVVLHRGLT